MANGTGFFAELRRRHVWRVAVAYVVVAWLLVQLASIVFPAFGAPDWVLKSVISALAIGFPVAMVLAWAFELTPDGVRRTEPASSPDARMPRDARVIGRKLNVLIIVVLAMAVAVLGWRLYAVQHRSSRITLAASPAEISKAATPAPSTPVVVASPAIPPRSIAVLPFENLSADKTNGYFADGMQELILTKLADIGSLKVISRASTAGYASRPDDLKSVGQQLGVAAILEGSVQKVGNEVLINVQLIDAATKVHLWGKSYQRSLDNVFGVEGEVAGNVAEALKAKLSTFETGQLATTLSDDVEANDAYLRAEYFANRGTIDHDMAQLKQALPLYRQAIAKVPDFALARARLSSAESELAWFGGAGEDVGQLQIDARMQARQSLDLAPDLPEAQLALGYSEYYGKGNYAAALRAFAAALKLRPNDAGALTAQGFVQRREGNFDAAIASLEQAQARDPRDTFLVSELGSTYMLANRWSEAEAAYRRALALDPDNVQAKLELSYVLLLARGDLPAALAMATGDAPLLRLQRVFLLTLQRRYADAQALLDGVPDSPDNFNTSGPKSLLQADLYRLQGEMASARALYAIALPQARAMLKTSGGVPINEAPEWGNIADAELGLGHVDKALAALRTSQALIGQAHDQVSGPSFVVYNASLYARAGRPDLAVRLLTEALKMPGVSNGYSPVLLWLDPAWDPIRKDPGFEALLQKYAEDKPAVTYDHPSAAASSP